MAGTVKVMIVDDSEESRQSIRLLLDFSQGIEVVAEAKDGAEALQKLSVVTPDIVLMDVNMPVMDGVQATERICLLYPQVSVIVLSVQNDVEYVRQCMRAGARDYLFKPVTVDVLTSTIDEVYRTGQTRQTRNTVAVLSEHFTHKSKVLMFASAKGGVGKTTIAVNTATALAEQGKQVAFVDFDLQFGDGGLFLNVTPVRTMVDLIRESSDIDPEVLERYLVRHSSGVHLLSGPKRPEEAEYVETHHIRLILQSLRKTFEYVIVDTTTGASEMFFAMLETADDCFMVNTLNLAVLKNNRLMLELVQDLGYDIEDIRHLLNRSNAKSGLKVKDAERILKANILWEMDNDYALVESSINEGSPFVIRDKSNRLSKQIYALTARLDEFQGERLSRRNPLRKLFVSKR